MNHSDSPCPMQGKGSGVRVRTYKPYSLYCYGQVDGRIKFQYMPRNKSNQLLVNIKQMDILFNPKADCYLILYSFELNCRISFDARYSFSTRDVSTLRSQGQDLGLSAGKRYLFPPYEDLIQEGKPFVFHIHQGIVEVDYLDADIFHHKY